MKKEKDEIDQLIEQALSHEEAEYYHQLDEQNIVEKFGGLFQGKMKWINIFLVIIQFVQFGFAIYFGYRFFNTTDVIESIRFGSGAFFLMMAMTMIKMYQFMEMNKNATIREIKRMELQMSLMAKRMKD